jgi:mevalonate kinase
MRELIGNFIAPPNNRDRFKTMMTYTKALHSKLFSSLAIATLMLAFLAPCSTISKADSSDLVSALPAQIPEILTGGNWSNGDIGGVYRAVVVLSKADGRKTTPVNTPPAAERKAEVFIQWIAYENGKATAKIVKTVSIKEFNEKQLRHAFLAMDTLKDNEMTLLVTSYDETADKDISVSVKATVPGKYEPARTTR